MKCIPSKGSKRHRLKIIAGKMLIFCNKDIIMKMKQILCSNMMFRATVNRQHCQDTYQWFNSNKTFNLLCSRWMTGGSSRSQVLFCVMYRADVHFVRVKLSFVTFVCPIKNISDYWPAHKDIYLLTFNHLILLSSCSFDVRYLLCTFELYYCVKFGTS